MRLEDFDYELPRELIAKTPVERRDASRLCVVRPGTPPEHRTFSDLPILLPEGALLIVNDARVIPARVFCAKPTGGRVELLLLGPEREGSERAGPEREGFRPELWRCLARPTKSLRPGTPLALLPPRDRPPRTPAPLATFVSRAEDGTALVEFRVAAASGLVAALDEWGELPLPPYIEREHGPTPQDRERYQTIFARVPGAVAAPTAGLHFSPEILAALERRGIHRASVTLHVGPGTFAPVRESDIERHVMHIERYDVPPATAEAFAAARREGRAVVAVGTTVVRTLESAAEPAEEGRASALRAGPGATRLFIRPGHRFRAVDLLVTNFHLPRSTLLMLVCAFSGREPVLAAYREAVARRYRFFSYGDAMLLHPAPGGAP